MVRRYKGKYDEAEDLGLVEVGRLAQRVDETATSSSQRRGRKWMILVVKRVVLGCRVLRKADHQDVLRRHFVVDVFS